MKRLLILLLTGLFAQLVVSCYPEGADNIEDYDVAITNYDKGADFSAFTTFSIPDTVVYFANDNSASKPSHELILFYPVITAEKGKAHQGSFNALLGDKRSAETDTWYSLQNRVSSETPPTLLLLSDDDRVVPPVNSTLYYNALKDNGVKASMHIYPTGGHGWGIRKNFKYKEQWQQTVLDWLQGIAK